MRIEDGENKVEKQVNQGNEINTKTKQDNKH